MPTNPFTHLHIRTNSHRKKLATAGFALLMEKSIRLTVSVIVWGYVANEMGTASFGKFSLFLSMIILVTPMTTLGIDQITKKRLVINKASSQSIILANLFLKSLGFLFVGAIGIMLLRFIQIESDDAFTICALYCGVLFRSGACFEAFLESVYATKISVILRTISLFVSASLLITAAYFDAKLFYFGLAVSAELVISFSLLSLIYSRMIKKRRLKLSFRLISYLIKESRIILICDICTVFMMRSNQALIAYYLSSVENGIFAVALRFLEAWYFIPYALSAIVFPKIIEAQTISSASLDSILKWTLEIFLFAALLVCIIVFLFADPTITLFFGSNYNNSAVQLKVMIFSTIFVFWGIILEPFEIAKNFTMHRLKRVTSGVIVSLLLNVVLIRIFGVTGASIAMPITFFYTYFISNAIFVDGRAFFKTQMSAFLFPMTRSLMR